MSQASSSTQPKEYRPVGILLAVGSGVLIGSSFVFKKKGLLSSQKGKVAGEGLDYLKSVMWWTGMTIMILGEICNFAAYAFVEAIVVTPMGALSVVISAILSHLILKEKLSLFGWIGSIQCILGASILALNAPEEQSVTNIADFKKLFLAPGFLSWGSVAIVTAVVLAVWVAPKYGHRSMLPYIGVCSLIGGLSVSCIQGLGACILTSIRGDNQFKNWFIYFLIAFVVVTLLTEIYYLNVALALYNTGKTTVTPTYYVAFTFCTLLTSVILYQGLKASARIIITVVLAFLVICTGITILQMSKVDPRKLANVDAHTTLLLEVAKQEPAPKASRELDARSRSSALSSPRRRRRTMSSRSQAPSTMPLGTSVTDVESGASQVWDPTLAESDSSDTEDTEIIVEKVEQPGIDSLRGTFGAIGTIIRNRRRTALAEAQDRSNSR
ncbi:magnesium transporter NIPA-domain-containing protein, partial [Thelephora terrestris]